MVNAKFIFKNLFFILSILILFQSFFSYSMCSLVGGWKECNIGTPKSATKTHYGSFWQKLGGGGGLAKIFRNWDWLRVSASEEKICSRAKTTFFCKQNNFTKLLTLLFFVNSVLLSYFNILFCEKRSKRM